MKDYLILDYSWIVRGKQRRAIIKVLDEPKTPTLIKEETDIKISNISDVLRSMEKRKLAKCLNPHDKLGRLYQLTAKGKEIKKHLSKAK